MFPFYSRVAGKGSKLIGTTTSRGSYAALAWYPFTYMVTVAVVGVGPISEQHLEFLAHHNQTNSQVELVGVCDLVAASVNYAASKYSCPGFQSLEEMLEQVSPEVVHILTPPNTHVRLAKQCLEAGSNVICEKPIAPDAKQAQELLDLARVKSLFITESHNYRFNQEIVDLIELSSKGELGDVCEVEVRMALDISESRFADQNMPNAIHDMPAGVIHDFITHLTYLLAAMSPGSEFQVVDANWRNVSDIPGFVWDNLSVELFCESTKVIGRIRFDARTYPDEFTVTVRGTDASVTNNIFSPGLTVTKLRMGKQLSPLLNGIAGGIGGVSSNTKDLINKVKRKTPYHGLAAMLEQTYAAIQSSTPLPVTETDIFSTAQLVDDMVALQSKDRA